MYPCCKNLFTSYFRSYLWRRGWVWVLVGYALAARIGGLTKPFWIDEAWSWLRVQSAAVRGDYVYSAKWIDAYQTSLLFLKLGDWLAWRGEVWPLRLPLLFMGLVAIWIGWQWGRRWRNWVLGALLATSLAVVPFKGFWDTTFRYYAVLIPMFLGFLLVCEFFRNQPTLRRWLAVLAMMTLAAWTHIISLPLVAIPVFYLVSPTISIIRSGRHLGFGHAQVLTRIAQLISCFMLWFVVTSGVALVTLGPKGLIGQVDKFSAGRGVVSWISLLTTNSDSEEQEPLVSTKVTSDVPNLARLQTYFAGVGEQLHEFPGGWIWGLISPSRDINIAAASYVYGGIDAYNEKWGHKTWLNVLSSFLFMIGLVWFLRRAPAMALGCSLVFVATNVLILTNQTRHFVAPRYFMYAILGYILVLNMGLAVVLRGAVWLAARRSRRLSLRLLVGSTGVCCVGLLLLGYRPLKRSAQYSFNNFDTLSVEACPNSEGPTMTAGVASQFLRAFDGLHGRRERYESREMFWREPRLNFHTEYYPLTQPGLATVEKLNPYEAYVWITPIDLDIWHPFKEMLPGLQMKPEPVVQEPGSRAMRMLRYDLGRRVFVTRGRLALPLMPRLRVGPHADARYKMVLYTETQGRYRLELGLNKDQRLRSAKLDDMPLTITELTPRPITLDPKAMRPELWRRLRHAGLHQQAAITPAALRLDPSFLHRTDGYNPINFNPDRLAVASLDLNGDAMSSHTLEMKFDQPVDRDVPILFFEHQLTNTTFYKLTRDLAYGEPQFFTKDDRFHVWIPVVLLRDRPINQFFSVSVMFAEEEALISGQVAVINGVLRGLKSGDILPTNCVSVPLAVAAANYTRGYKFICTLTEAKDDGGRVRIQPENQAVTANAMELGRVKFDSVNGALIPHFVPPAGSEAYAITGPSPDDRQALSLPTTVDLSNQ